ncbi:MAG: polymerase beta domain protein region protein [Candidatus Collierbacteria bacterium GW2011_GWC2_45_40]|nr:MAG: polymerase beta domain protein region protein [Candidatus Collierbacteria bacterium GW2011_GWC2_45_40]
MGSIPITRSKCDRNAQKVTIINMESQLITLPVEKFKKFPEHYRVLKNSVDLLSADYRVLGIYLTGSFANGSPDQYSDLDVNLIVSVGDRESIIKEQETLREKVAKIATQFPATHLNNPYQIIVFYEGTYPIHVDYEYKTSEDLKPMAKGKDVIVVFDRTGELNSWKKACLGAAEEVTPTLDQLQYFEDRFWGWIIYTHGKIKRGELWEARDAIEYIRSNVLNRLAYYQLRLKDEGNRRLESKFTPEILNMLEKTIPKGHDKESYRLVLSNIVATYTKLFDRAVLANAVEGINQADRDYLTKAVEF